MKRFVRLAWVVSTLLIVLAGCTRDSRDGATVKVDLQATRNNVGQIGYANLSPVDNATSVYVFVSGVQGILRPVRLYTFIYEGPCSQMATQPAYELNDRVTTTRTAAGWDYSRRAPVPLSELRSKKYALLIRSSPEEGNAVLFCGDIP